MSTKPSRLMLDQREAIAQCAADRLFDVVANIGGNNGWYYADWLWRLRGFIDSCRGGVGLRRNGTNHRKLQPGEILDFWRIEDVQPGRKLLLKAEMKVHGDAWLEFEVRPISPDRSIVKQTARYFPYGPVGIMYWYSLLPIHAIVFRGMIRALIERAESRQ